VAIFDLTVMELPQENHDPIFVSPNPMVAAVAEQILAAGQGRAGVVELPKPAPESMPQTDDEREAYLVRQYREHGMFAPRTHGNPLSRDLTDDEMLAKVRQSREAWERAEAKRQRKSARRLPQ
jgi:hypothetical protein